MELEQHTWIKTLPASPGLYATRDGKYGEPRLMRVVCIVDGVVYETFNGKGLQQVWPGDAREFAGPFPVSVPIPKQAGTELLHGASQSDNGLLLGMALGMCF